MIVRTTDDFLGVLKEKRKKSSKVEKQFEGLLNQEGTEIDMKKWHRLTLRMPKSLYQLLEFEMIDNNIDGLAEMGRILLKEAIIARH